MLPNTELILEKYKSKVQLISTIAIIAAAIVTIANIYPFILNTFWKPKVQVLSVDFLNGIAKVNINGKEKTLYENSTLAAGASWGVRFGKDGKTDKDANRIELIKNDLVVDIISVKK
jgi:hypothetical protein